MRAYLGQIDHTGLRRFLLENAIPPNSIVSLDREWSSSTTTGVRAVPADEDAEALRCELGAGGYGEACSLYMDRAVEVLAFGKHSPRILSTDR